MDSSYGRVIFTGPEQAIFETVAWEDGLLGPDEVEGPTLVSLVSAGTETGWYAGAGQVTSRAGGRPGYTAIMEVAAVGAEVGRVRPGDLVFVQGRHQSHQRISVDRVVPVPKGLAPETALFCRMMSVSMATLATTPARAPALVMVTGLGPVGLMGALVFQRCGYEVLAVEPDADRRALALAKGVKDVRPAIPLDDYTVRERVELVVECCGLERVILDSCHMMMRGGEIVLVGYPWQPTGEVTLHEVIEATFYRLVTIRSGWEDVLPKSKSRWHTGPTAHGNLAGAMQWLKDGFADVDDLYRLRQPADCQQVYQDLLHRRADRLTVVFDWRKNP